MIEITPEDRTTPVTVADMKELFGQLAEAFAAAPPLQLSGAEVLQDEIGPGTRCILVNLVNQIHLQGREVEVIGPYAPPSGETGEWFALRAPWIRREYPGQVFITPRRCLRPITENAR